MKCECGENNWNIKEDDVYGICICTCNSCGYIESFYLENNNQIQMYPIDTAPKDVPILAWCDDDCMDESCAASSNANENARNLCLYHGHAEGMSSVGTGYAIIEWGGSWDDSTYENPNAGYMPDWWFREGSEFEEAANPTHWTYLPENRR